MPPVERPTRAPCPERWAASVVVAVILVLTGFLGLTGSGALVLAASVVLLALIVGRCSWKCCGRNRCAVLDHLLLGSSAALGVLGLLLATGSPVPFVLPALATAAVLTAVLAVATFVLRCRGGCCDEAPRDCEPVRVPEPATIRRSR